MSPGPLDPKAIEARTQQIGQELFAHARKEHTHLAPLNRWTAQVLNWCMADCTLKGNILRFIDVLPSLENPSSVLRHLRDYFPRADQRLPAALRLGISLSHKGLLTTSAVSSVIRRLTEEVARQFIAEEDVTQSAKILQELAGRGATCSFDVLGEEVTSEAEADRYAKQYLTLLRWIHEAYAGKVSSEKLFSCGPVANLSIKPSALTPRFDPLCPAESVERALQRLMPIVNAANNMGALINLDMEQYSLRDLTLELAKRVLLESDAGANVKLGIVIQAYLRDANENLEDLIAWLLQHDRHITIRLVKGAYWDSEVALACGNSWAIPVYQHKHETDLAFEHLSQRLVGTEPCISLAIASHNLRSIAHAMAVTEARGLAKAKLEFQLLYGMGEVIHRAVAAQGYPVCIYTPIGKLIPGMGYLVRRILENTANESFLRQEFYDEATSQELLKAPSEQLAQEKEAPSPDVGEIRMSEPPVDFSKQMHRDRMSEAIASVRARLGGMYPLVVDGDYVETAKTLRSENPSHPDQVVGNVAEADAENIERAVRTACRVQREWKRTPIFERAEFLRRAAMLIREERYELAAWAIFEAGKTWREADTDITEAIDFLIFYSDQMEALAKGKPLIQAPGEINQYRYQPRGVAVVIAPWNFPLAIVTGMTSAALITGNTIIIKPAEQSPVLAAHLVRILEASGIPKGVVQYLPGQGEVVGSLLVRHPGIQTILFTGSKAVGLDIIGAAAKVRPGQRFVKHVVTEMGGKNAIIIDEDADLDAAITGILSSAFGYQGQKCSAASRLIIHTSVYDRLIPRLIMAMDRLVVSDPVNPSADLGPLIDRDAHRRLSRALEDARKTADILYEYRKERLPKEGFMFGPALVADVDTKNPLAVDELFGPLLCVFRVKTFADALELANDTDYALTGGVYSRSPSHIRQASLDFDVGNLYINRSITGALVGRQPFGGHRLSGLGTKAGGPDYLLQLLIPKTISTNAMRHGMPLD